MLETRFASLGVVGDIGGTHARFALVEPGRTQVRQAETLLGCDHPSIEAALEAYLAKVGERVSEAVIAVAGPVVDGGIRLTNLNWTSTESGIARACGLGRVHLINDYAALARSAPRLSGDDLHRVGPPAGEGEPQGNLAIIGAGTGFGVSGLVRDDGNEAVLVTEGGHIAFAPCSPLEGEVWRVLAARFGRVSIERILSGPGLQNLYEALCEVENRPALYADPQAISRGALAREPGALHTVEQFCAIMGSVAGDFALSFGASGGVYIAGGIAPRLLEALDGGVFRSRFEDKGRFADYVRRIPTYVITHPHAALIGAASWLKAHQTA